MISNVFAGIDSSSKKHIPLGDGNKTVESLKNVFLTSKNNNKKSIIQQGDNNSDLTQYENLDTLVTNILIFFM